MRRTVRTVILVLAATTSLLVNTSPAAASYLYDWASGINVIGLSDDSDNGAVLPLDMDIRDTGVAWDSDNYYFRMDLGASPTGSNSGRYLMRNYSIFIAPASTTSFDTGNFEEIIGTTYLGRSPIAVYGLSLDDGGLEFLDGVQFLQSGSTLEWSISRSDLAADFTVWWGTIGNLSLVDLSGGMDVRTPQATPVPGAVWLLASGVLGLICMKRRSSVPGSEE